MRLLAVILTLVFSTIVSAQGDWSADATEERRLEIIRRYRSMLERNPVEGRALDRLLQEVGGGRNLDRLIEEYEEAAASDPESFASFMILGHLYKRRDRVDEAIEAYRTAGALRPESVLPIRSTADAAYRAGRIDEARETYEQALELTSDRDDREDILFALADIAFDARDFDTAAGYFERIVELSPRDVYIRQQLADTLVEYGRYEDALLQYEAIAEMTGRDTHLRAMTSGTIGDVLLELGRANDAIERYRRAQGYVRRGNWLYNDLERRIIDAYRTTDDLPALIAEYESAWRRPSFEQMMLLAELYDEVGRDDEALEMLRGAVRSSRRSVDARLDLIRLLERRGEIDEVVAQYREVMRLSDEPIHGFMLAQLLRTSGDQEGASETLEALERQYRNSTSVLLQIADRHLRWGDGDRALALFERVLELEPDDPDHLVGLGDLHWMEGRRDEAQATWQRVPGAFDDPAEGQARLGQVYRSHLLYDAAIEQLRSALELSPESDRHRLQLAETLEEARRVTDAIAVWEELVAASDDAATRALARSRVIDLLTPQLARARLDELTAQRHADPENLEVAYGLAELYLALDERAEAEEVYLDILSRRPQDLEALMPLSDLYVDAGHRIEAIEVLERVAALSPDDAGPIYQQLANLSLQIFDDEAAVRYGERAVAADPHDARAYARLGETFLRTRQLERAVNAYLEATRLNRRVYGYALSLADLYVAMERLREADDLYREVFRRSRERTEVIEAGRRAIQVNTQLGTTDELLVDWTTVVRRPRTSAGSGTAVQQLVVELVELMVGAVLDQIEYGSTQARTAALEELADLRGRCSRALISMIGATDLPDRLRAVELLGQLGASEAVVSLVRIAGEESEEGRIAAVLALGQIGDIAAVEALVTAAADSNATVRALSAWSLGRMGSADVEATLLTLLRQGERPEVQAQAALALGRVQAGSASDALAAAARTDDIEVARAALWALGVIGDGNSRDVISNGLHSALIEVRRAAAWSLGLLPADDRTVEVLLRSYWTEHESVRAQAAQALVRIGLGDAVAPALPDSAFDVPWDRDAGRLDTTGFLDGLLPAPSLETQLLGASLLPRYSDAVEAVAAELMSAGDRPATQRLLDDLYSWGEGGQSTDLPIGLYSGLLEARDEAVRWRAVRAVGVSFDGTGPVVDLLTAALSDSSTQVRRQSILSLGRIGAGTDELSGWLQADDCTLRAAAAETLRRAGLAAAELERMAAEDPCEMARQSAGGP
jgi:tetratricopeptide (TPR) repeat protein